ncbi:159aa long hypothetical protein [Pyrococcus horikoshii OT3]|uniref:Uncharacterized protein n=1 Tax=Pyrococcus horikoshii (strain ATCC 700860 / DSM 12428 / JCM 9974 / NBRC 100139 / OT-3) TaxID=70601 RepID=O58202_PYRHO|nr:159aa long hypothetical protein [Pyrococcus horikoshii OT3]
MNAEYIISNVTAVFLPILLFLKRETVRIIITRRVIGITIFTMEGSTLIGLIIDAIPMTINMSSISAPIMFPTLTFGIFFSVAVKEFANSGRDVPIETSVTPITTSGIPIALAIFTALSTTSSAPRITIPPERKRIRTSLVTLHLDFFSTSSSFTCFLYK